MKKLFIIFALFFFLPALISAQWIQTNGPVSVNIFSLADNGNDIFSGVGGFDRSGLFHSPDHGANWSVIGFEGLPVSYIAADGETVYAGLGNRLYKTTDLGMNWDTCNVETPISSLAADVGKVVLASSSQGVFVSTNSGQSWTNSNAGLTELNIVKVSFSGSNIFAATGNSGIYRSTDNGSSWAFFGLNHLTFTSLFAVGNTVYAATESPENVYLNSGNDTNWSIINNGIIGTIRCFESNSAYDFAAGDSGVFRTSDKGQIWERTDEGNFLFTESLITPGNEVFAGIGRKLLGVFRSTDNGESWNSASGGLEMRKILGMGSISGYLFSGCEIVGVKRTSNTGNTWLSAGQVLYLTGFAANDHSLYISQIWDQAGILRSSDLGLTWSDIGNGRVFDIRAFAVTNERVYAYAGNPIYPGLYMTTNDGINWTNLSGGINWANSENQFADYIYAHENVLIISNYYSGLHMTTNDGANWISMNNGTPVNNSNSIIAKDSLIFAAFPGFGVYVTADKGSSWSPVNNGLTDPDVNCFLIVQNNLLAGTQSGVYYSKNNGQLWNELSNGTGSQNITALSSDGTYLFAGTEFSGVWKYFIDEPLPVELQSFTANVSGSKITLDWITTSELNNDGFEIQRKISGPERWTVQGFVKGNINSNNQNHYTFDDMNVPSGSYNYRLKQIDINGNFSIYDLSSKVSVGIPREFTLDQNYPNPFNPVTTIGYSLPEDGMVNIRVFDILGREVKILVNEMKAAGSYNLIFNAASLPGGVYYYEMKAGDYTAVRKFILSK